MGPLASSHTSCTRTGRRLLIMFFALVLVFYHSIVTVGGDAASDSGTLRGTGLGDSLARLRIRVQPARPHDVIYRVPSNGASQPEARPPGLRVSAVDGLNRKILGDISPPGMWPTPDGQDDVPPVVNDEFRRRSLLTGGASPPRLAPFFTVMHSSQDGEDAFLRQALASDKTYPVVHWGSIVNKLKQLGSVINRSSLGFGIRLPGSLTIDAAAADDSSEQITEHGDQLLRNSISGRVAVPDADRTALEHLENEMWSSTGHFEMSINLHDKLRMAEPKFRSRTLLQGDISPPGMWPDDDDDESLLSESTLLRRRRLLSSN